MLQNESSAAAGSRSPANAFGAGSAGPKAAGPGVQVSAADSPGRGHPDLSRLIAAYFRHTPAADRPRSDDDVTAIVQGHLKVGRRRSPGQVNLAIFNPGSFEQPDPLSTPAATEAGAGRWTATSTVVDIVNDDMPFLLESVIGTLHADGLTVQRAVHPILTVRRDVDGSLIEVSGESATDSAGSFRESWIHLLIDRISDAERAEQVEDDLRVTLGAVRAVVTDSTAMIGAAAVAAGDLRSSAFPGSESEMTEAADLLHWLTAGNFVFLGYRCDNAVNEGHVSTDPGSGLGLFRGPGSTSLNLGHEGEPGHQRGTPAGPAGSSVVVLGQLSSGVAIGRQDLPLTVAVQIFGPHGALLRRHHFLGMLTPRARIGDIASVPVLRRTVDAVLTGLGATADSYTGQRAVDILSGYPRASLFWAGQEQIADMVDGVLQLSNRPRVRAFLQPDPAGRFVSVLVYLPRERDTTVARLAMQQILLDRLAGTDLRSTAQIGDFRLAAVHFVVITTQPAPPIDLDELDRALQRTIRTWDDQLVSAVVGGVEELDTAAALSRYAEAFEDAYKSEYPVDTAVRDLARLDALAGPTDLGLELSVDPEMSDQRRLKLYVTAGRITLSRVLPVLQSLGTEVIDERPFDVRRTDGTQAHIYDFGLRFPVGAMEARSVVAAAVEVDQDARDRFTEAFDAAWTGRCEVDGFNALIVGAGLRWRQVAVLRAYARYLQQIGTPYTQGYLEQVLTANPGVTADLVELFAVRFDPAAPSASRSMRESVLIGRIGESLDAVASLDADRILRLFLALITGTVRTNAYRGTDGSPCLCFKLVPADIPGIPKPIPAHEIWVYSPRVEGVHLRFGAVARGGLRWSDRPEDFRTEILGLVKAQEVKNAVIVPVGAKGGFVLRKPPPATGDALADREALTAEGVACYRIFIAGLLDLTDNRIGGTLVPPPDCVRHDGDDSYLVVAADKGTATFSDIANAVAAEYRYWLGDAFASGGSAGYDHKAMAITARGAWESVRHHFRELGVDPDGQTVTCVGIGDMSGDVFGNGMLLSRHLALVAAFDHRHVFVDPHPDPALAFAERQRLFALPRSSWADYDPQLISAGGGVWPRSAKSIPISLEMAAAIGLEPGTAALAPADLLRGILLAPVDLLWNGGIGTYIKSATESQAAAGDKANDWIRVNGNELRAAVVGEGGNLGVTQLGRIEYARAGGRINTDAIDNSAGVDTSDHEVNIKIALQPAVAAGALTGDQRQELLVSMTSEVAALVLADNVEQNRVLGVSRFHAGSMISVHDRLINALVAAGKLDRALEFLPSRAELTTRESLGQGLTGPELAVVLAYVKSFLTEQMAAGPLPADPAFRHLLDDYFPRRMRAGGPASASAEQPTIDVGEHPLARQIIATMAVNRVVNAAGTTFAFRLAEENGASPDEAISAFTVVAAAFGLDRLWRDIAALAFTVSADVQNMLLLEVRRLVDRAARWLLANRPRPMVTADEIDRLVPAVTRLIPLMPRLVQGVERKNVRTDAARLIAGGTPHGLAFRVAYLLYTFSVLDVTEVAADTGSDPVQTAEVLFALSARFDFDRVLSAVSDLPRGDRWHALARQALRDDLYHSLRQLTAAVLSDPEPGGPGAAGKVMQWERRHTAGVTRACATLAQITAEGARDLASLSVAASELRSMI